MFRVRELLSVHNIGQRLFAKYVLGLSQGTVSELLSKPKSWDKLTEKGRDSYRKMHAWVWDDQAILLLKTLIPRKGELLRSSNSLMKTGKFPPSLFPSPDIFLSSNPGLREGGAAALRAQDQQDPQRSQQVSREVPLTV